MLTKLRIRNFKQFDDVEIELGQTVVFVGPNNSGKTTALQALTLWEIGVRRWYEKRANTRATQRTGVAINRKDIMAIPVPEAELLWYKLRTKGLKQESRTGKQSAIRIQIILNGITDEVTWEWGMEFEFVNDESLMCRPIQKGTIPDEVLKTRFAFLPTMSGLIDTEDKLERGSILRRIGEGRTAEVLRNLCYRIYETEKWERLKTYIIERFQVDLLAPDYVDGELSLSYRETNGYILDISSAGRGMLQVLLLLAYMYDSEGATLLLDEPDAHLEILRQREVYQLLSDVAREMDSQVIIATHSEVILDEAAERKDTIIAFVGEPHRPHKLDQVYKALRDIPMSDYYLAVQKGWILYLEGSTDLAILRAFAERLQHPAADWLKLPFWHELKTNQPQKVRDHFYGLQEAKNNLVGFVLFDRIDTRINDSRGLVMRMWQKREIENYLATPETLIAYAESLSAEAKTIMETVVQERIAPIALRDRQDIWWSNTKMSNDFLEPLFKNFFHRLGKNNEMAKKDFHLLAPYIPLEQIDPEIIEKLDAIVQVAQSAIVP